MLVLGVLEIVVLDFRGARVHAYHFKLGLFSNTSTFMPKTPTVKVKGRKINVIQDSRHKLMLSCSDCRESRISTDLYIFKK